MEGNTKDNSPHCVNSRGSGDDELGSCNDGSYVGGPESYVDGASVDGNPSQSNRLHCAPVGEFGRV